MNYRRLHNISRRRGFTMAELLMALLVSSIILGAVASLASALDCANAQTVQMNRRQTALRFTTVRIAELIKQSKRIFSLPTAGVALWTGDANDDGFINASELAYVEPDGSGQSLQLLEFPGQSQSVSISDIESGTARDALVAGSNERVTILLADCTNIQFTVNASKFVNITFDLTENNITSYYQICATMISSADNLIGPGGALVSGDDD
jgi:prepilin-type N-terminal cleavage/methylation domain-containing protein